MRWQYRALHCLHFASDAKYAHGCNCSARKRRVILVQLGAVHMHWVRDISLACREMSRRSRVTSAVRTRLARCRAHDLSRATF